jgi:hypothetical protein
MRIHGVIAIIAGTLVWCASSAQAQLVQVNLVPGQIKYEFDDTSGNPISNLTFPSVNSTATIQVYLVQTGGNITGPTGTVYNDIFSGIGLNSLSVRLNYATGTTVAQVRSRTATDMVANPQPATGNTFDFVSRFGSTVTTGNYPAPNNNIPNYSGTSANQTTDITKNAEFSESYIINTPPAMPGAEDPKPNPLRILIGTFTLQAVAAGTQNIYAVDAFDVGNGNNLTAAVPGASASDPNQLVGLDPFLNQNVGGQNKGAFTTLAVTVQGVPEPGTMSLAGLAAAGLVAWRRRRTTAVAA